MAWRKIDSAPKDGRAVRVKRIFKGEKIYDGLAAWRTVTFASFENGRHGIEPEYTDTGWMVVDRDKRVPEPTHWTEGA